MIGCQSTSPRELSFAERVASAHGTDEWQMEQVLQGELLARFETGNVIDLRFRIETDGPRVWIAVGDGTPEGKTSSVTFDGRDVRVELTGPGVANGRELVEKWPMLIALPFRMAQRGVKVEELGRRELGSVAYDVAKVTFERPLAGLGEWALVYVEPQTRLLKAVVYAIDDEPRAISFYDFEDVSGVRLGTAWKFWKWSEGAGIYDRPIGTGRVFNLGFTTAGKETFGRPANEGASQSR